MQGGQPAPAFKADPDIKSYNGAVKGEPDLMDIPLVDDDIYEDAGDLDFAGVGHGFYLTRLPKYVWEYWSQLDEDQEIQIGTIRVEGSLQSPDRVRTPAPVCNHHANDTASDEPDVET